VNPYDHYTQQKLDRVLELNIRNEERAKHDRRPLAPNGPRFMEFLHPPVVAKVAALLILMVGTFFLEEQAKQILLAVLR
jgi:hypothetical protein